MNASIHGPGQNGSEAIQEDLSRHAEAAAGHVEQLRQGSSDEVRRLMADMEDLIKKVAHVTDADIARVRDKAQRTLNTARRSLQDGAARVRAGSRDIAERTDGYVHEQPWTALGVAAAIGVLIGVLASRR